MASQAFEAPGSSLASGLPRDSGPPEIALEALCMQVLAAEKRATQLQDEFSSRTFTDTVRNASAPLPRKIVRETRRIAAQIFKVALGLVGKAETQASDSIFRQTANGPAYLAGSRQQIIRTDTLQPHPAGTPLVSIIITCVNYGEYVRRAVESARAQTLGSVEIILVEGGSDDGKTPAVVRDIEAEGIRVLWRNERYPAGSNRNFGIESAQGKYICCLDADDWLAPTYIEKIVFNMEHGGIDVMSAAVTIFGEEQSTYGVDPDVNLEVLLDRNELATCAVFRRDLWAKVGGYRDFGDGRAGTHIHEDWEFWVRLAAAGARISNLGNDYLFHYRAHNASQSRRMGIPPADVQRRLIREANHEVLTPEAVKRSVELCRASVRTTNGSLNLLQDAGAFPKVESLLLIMPWMVIGGAERLLSTICIGLRDAGWDISVITTHRAMPIYGDTSSWFARSTRHHYELPKFLPDHFWRDFLDYLIEVRRISSVLIVGSKFGYESVEHIKQRHPGVKVSDLLFNTVGHTQSNRKYAAGFDGNIVENREVRDWLIANGEPEERITLIESGVDLDLADKTQRGGLRTAFELEPSDIVVGFAGRWSQEKNPLGFIEIAERLADNPRLHFVMIGTGRLRDAVVKRVAGNREKLPRFHLLDHMLDAMSIVADFDILVLPSILDGRPMAVVEALSLGVAVVASSVGGVPDLVHSGHNGELCQPGDISAFVEAISKLEADRDRLGRYKANARSFAEAKLDARLMIDKYATSLGSGSDAMAKRGSRTPVDKANVGRGPRVRPLSGQ